MKYKLVVSSDPGLGTLGGNTPITTTATSYTGTNFPASAQLYWKVEAIDRSDNGLAWCPTQQFQKTLAAPTFVRQGVDYSNPGAVDGIPVLQWDAMPGAIAYNLKVTRQGGSTSTYTDLQTTAFAPQSLSGMGTFTWRVAAEYPTASVTVTSGDSSPDKTFVRTLAAPTGMHAAVNGQHQVVMTWDPKNGARSYAIQLASDDQFGFGSIFDTPSTETTGYAPDLTNGKYVEGGQLYWRIATVDADGNQGSWSTAQSLVMPLQIHASTNQFQLTAKVTTTVKVYAKTASGAAIPGVLVKVAGAGVTAASKTTGSGGSVSFKLKPTKKGTVTFTLSKSGCVSTTVKLTVS